MAENKDIPEAGRILWRLLEEHRLSMDIEDTDLRVIQEIELKILETIYML